MTAGKARAPGNQRHRRKDQDSKQRRRMRAKLLALGWSPADVEAAVERKRVQQLQARTDRFGPPAHPNDAPDR